MTLFFVLASLLVVAAMAILLPLLTGQRFGSEIDHREANVAIARERQHTLRRAADAGDIDEETYQSELASLEQSLAADLAAADRGSRDTRGQWLAVGAIAILVPIGAGVLYMQIGTPEAMDSRFLADLDRQAQAQAQAEAQTAAGNAAMSGEQQAALAELLPQLEQRLADVPDDVEGWRLLGRTRLTMGNFAGARDAFQKADSLVPDDPDTLASLAEATAMANGGNLAGTPVALLERVLAATPGHPQSRWLLAIARQQAGEHAAAISLFEGLRDEFTGDPEATASVQQMIDRSRQALDGSAPPAAGDGAAGDTPAPDGPSAGQTAAAAGSAAITAKISLNLPDDTTLDPQQAVFVYAKAVEGPPMPLAAARLTVADLPAEVTLNDASALMPNMTLSAFDEVTLGARVSMSGDAIAQPGDWIGEVSPVATDAPDPVAVTINRKISE